jgi:hypothetical protein
MRKLILLALGGAAVAYFLKSRGDESSSVAPAATSYAPQTAMPDTSADDPLVRQQEAAAAAEAGAVGGPADTVTADLDPEMRPVAEGSGDFEETFEQTEDQGR